MDSELIQFEDVPQVAQMSSLEIARITGKGHNDVMKAIRKMEPAWEKVAQGKFTLGEYKDKNNQSRPCYYLDKRECLFIATKFHDEARAKLILRWEQLEMNERNPRNAILPKTQAEIILMQAQQLVAQEQMIRQIETKQEALEAKVSEIAVRTKTDIKYSTIVGFASRFGIKVPLERASTLGRVATNICRQFQLETGRVPDPRFGSVRTYPDSVLFDTFEKYYPNIRFR